MLQYGNLLIDNARNHPRRLAVVSSRRALTYTELNRESNCVANGLKRRGLKKGDRLAMLGKNSVEWVVMWQACQKLGVVFVPLHTRMKAGELSRILKLSSCCALVFDESFACAAEEIRRECDKVAVLICLPEERPAGPAVWEEIFGSLDDREAKIPVASNDPALILFTSGTTSLPKGVVRTQEMVVLHGLTLAMDAPGEEEPVMLTTAPLHHSGGLLCLLKMSVLGGTLVIHERFEPEVLLGLMAERRVTQVMMLPPIVYERLYTGGAWKTLDLSAVREVCVSAGRCTNELAEYIFEMFPNCWLRPSWGSTETCSVTGMRLTRAALEKDPGLVNCVGRVNVMTEVRVVDETGQDVPEGTVGQALVRSPMVFSGYLGTGRCKENPFLKGGWFQTGDLLRMDPESRCFYFMDRQKDMIKTGGENVYAPEVERVIMEYPAVQDCAVVGIPDARFDEGVAAAVVLKPGFTLDPEELVEFCRKRLPSFKKPRYIGIVPELPVNSIGKVQKNLLRKQADTLFRPVF